MDNYLGSEIPERDDTDIEGAREVFDSASEKQNRKLQFGFLPIVPPAPVNPEDSDGAYDRYVSSRLAVSHIRLFRLYYVEQLWAAGILIGGVGFAAWMPSQFIRVLTALLLGGAVGRYWGLGVAIRELQESRCCNGSEWSAPSIE